MDLFTRTRGSRPYSAQKRSIETSILAIAIIALMLAGITGTDAAEKTTDQLLDEARAAVKGVSIQDVKGIVERKEKVVLLDIRDMKQFSIDHIEGAQGMSRAVGLSPRILEHHLQKIAPDKTARIIVYCEFDTRSPLAVKEMNAIGYSNAVYMKGGVEAWKKAGYPLEKK
jgi:rhodanese-related sulfurtransferase